MPALSYSDFCRRALYSTAAAAPGYYRANRVRIGRAPHADFYTSSSFPLFPKLLATALRTLCELHRLPSPALIELGPEPAAPLFPAPPPGFSRTHAFPLGTLENRESIRLRSSQISENNIRSATARQEIENRFNPPHPSAPQAPTSPPGGQTAQPCEGALSSGATQPHPISNFQSPISDATSCCVFSNELFDALPFERLQRREDGWHLLGLDPAQKILDLDLGLFPPLQNPASAASPSSPSAPSAPDSPSSSHRTSAPSSSIAPASSPSPVAPTLLQTALSPLNHFPLGATLDLSIDTLALLDQLFPTPFSLATRAAGSLASPLSSPAPSTPPRPQGGRPASLSHGGHTLFVAFDYGLSFSELLARPRPTARAYHQHRQLSLAEALELPQATYDLTHHIIWDLLSSALAAHGFTVAAPITQEAFFTHYAAAAFPALSAAERSELATLLHPAHMGHSFEVLIAHR